MSEIAPGSPVASTEIDSEDPVGFKMFKRVAQFALAALVVLPVDGYMSEEYRRGELNARLNGATIECAITRVDPQAREVADLYDKYEGVRPSLRQLANILSGSTKISGASGTSDQKSNYEIRGKYIITKADALAKIAMTQPVGATADFTTTMPRTRYADGDVRPVVTLAIDDVSVPRVLDCGAVTVDDGVARAVASED